MAGLSSHFSLQLNIILCNFDDTINRANRYALWFVKMSFAIHANRFVDYIYFFSLGNSIYWTFGKACSTIDTFVSYSVCHSFLRKINKTWYTKLQIFFLKKYSLSNEFSTFFCLIRLII